MNVFYIYAANHYATPPTCSYRLSTAYAVVDDDGVEEASFAGERDQLATKALVGEHERAARAQVRHDVEQCAPLGHHQVGGTDGAAAVHAEVAVDQRAAARALHVVQERDRVREVTLDVVVFAVLHSARYRVRFTVSFVYLFM